MTIGKHGIVYVSRDQDLNSLINLGPNSNLFTTNIQVNFVLKKRIPIYILLHNIWFQEIKSIDLHPLPPSGPIINVSGAGDW